MTPTSKSRLEKALAKQKSANTELEILRFCIQNECEVFGPDPETCGGSVAASKFEAYYALGEDKKNADETFEVFGNSRECIERVAKFYSLLRWESQCVLIELVECPVWPCCRRPLYVPPE